MRNQKTTEKELKKTKRSAKHRANGALSPLPLSSIHHQLLENLLTLEHAAFQRVMRELLLRSGYLSVQSVGRKHERGRTHNGGLDLVARTQTDVASALTLVQIKQYRRVVSRRFVDELRGTMLRLNAQHGLLLTTSSFSRVAQRAARQSEVAPITLLDGQAVCEMMQTHRLGVAVNTKEEAALDATFFDKLAKKSRSTSEKEKTDAKAEASAASANDESNVLQPASPSATLTNPSANAIARDEKEGEMLWRTHVLIGLNTLWLFDLVPHGLPLETLPLVITASAFGSLLPDLDASESKIKHWSVARIKPFYLPALAVHRRFGHRGFSHSLLALALLAALTLPLAFLLGWPAWLALLLGYAGHLAADGCTRSGIPLFYPNKKRYHLLPPSLRFVTGSQAEEVLLPLLSVLLLILLLRQLPQLPALLKNGQ